MNINSTSSSYVNNPSSNKGFSGLASGMDTESMVEALLSGTQAKIDKQNAIKQQTQWKQQIYRDLIKQINSFQTKYFTSGSATNFMSSSFFNAMGAVSSSSAIKVSASSSAQVGTTTVKVDQLASASKMTSNKVGHELAGQFQFDKITEQLANQKYDVTFDVDGKEVNVDFKDLFIGETTTDPKKPILKDAPSNAQIVQKLQDAFKSAGLDSKVEAKEENGEIVITSKEIKDKDGKVETPAAKISVSSKSSEVGLNILGLKAGAKATEFSEGQDDKKVTGNRLTGDKQIDTGNYFGVEVTFNGVKSNIKVDMNQVLKAGTDNDPKKKLQQQTNKFKDLFNEQALKTFGTTNDGKANVEMRTDNTAGKEGLFVIDSNMPGGTVMITGSNTWDTINVINGDSNRVGMGGELSLYFKDAFNGKDSTTLTINGTEIVLTKDMTVSDMIRKVNSSDAGVNMSYLPESDEFVLTHKNTGAGFKVEVGSNGQMNDFEQALFKGKTATAGQNAIVTVNGNKIESSSNTFDYNGLNITANEVTKEPVTITVSRDSEKIVEGVKSFIEDYNALLDTINGLVGEEATYREYPPLTEAQKKEMSAKEIEAWEKKAKEGLLRNDHMLSDFVQKLRTTMFSKPDGSTIALYDLGIDTGAWDQKGKLVLSSDGEAKLRAMIDSDPDAVVNLFTGKNGLASQLDNVIKEVANTSSASKGSLVEMAGYEGTASAGNNTLSHRLADIDTKIKDLKSKYEQEKSRYWRQFNYMEKIVGQMGSQSAWLAQQWG